jgi:hypothetical protein
VSHPVISDDGLVAKFVGYVVTLTPLIIALGTAVLGIVRYRMDQKERRLNPPAEQQIVQGQTIATPEEKSFGLRYVQHLERQIRDEEREKEAAEKLVARYRAELLRRGIQLPDEEQ